MVSENGNAEEASAQATVPARQCGDCSMCCKIMGVQEIDKPKDAWCPHFARGHRCTIYPDRPQSCRNFVCNWLLDPAMGDEWKPNKCKMVVTAKEMTLAVHVDSGADRPWRKEPYYSQLLFRAKRGITRGETVMVFEHGRSILVLPDQFVDLGVLEVDDQIGITEVITDTGLRWEARVVKAGEAHRQGATGKGWVHIQRPR